MLADIVEVVILNSVSILWVVAFCIPPVFTLAYEATILVLYAIITPKGRVTATTSETST
jgi:hypothetical protein